MSLLFLSISRHLQGMGKNHITCRDGVTFWHRSSGTRSLLPKSLDVAFLQSVD